MLEENNNFGEQPMDSVVHTVATENEGTTNSEGSPLGKFKNAETLLGAYNELQSEFTRKCQKLSEVQKKLEETSDIQNAGKNSDVKTNEFAWSEKLDDFLKNHKNASEFVEDITNELISNDDLKNSDEALEKAYFKVMENKYVPQGDLSKDPSFLEKYIYSNQDIKNKIINEYVESLQNVQSPITIATMGQTGSVASTPKFENLEDAKVYVENMFKF